MFHVGGARSALFNWAVAKESGGIFVLRIEDTDASRNEPKWVEQIISSLAVLGMHSDDPTFEGPYFQSENAHLHTEASQRLFSEGQAYYCDCTREMLKERTGSDHAGYDGFCRNRGLEPAPGRALRFKTPLDGETVVIDLIRGNPTFQNSLMEDFVIARGDGSAVFLLANVVDDIDERITHVIRGEEHLSNTPKQVKLWEALGAEPPVWAHLPVIVNEKRQKLSKRRDKVSLEDFLHDGILPEAMVNYLMLLGWSPGNDQEKLPFDQMVARFDIADVNSASAFFDVKKLSALNGDYIRELAPAEFEQLALNYLSSDAVVSSLPWKLKSFDEAAFLAVAPLVQTRIATLGEIAPNVEFLFIADDALSFEDAAWAKAMKDPGAEVLEEVRRRFGSLADWEAETLKVAGTEAGELHGLKLGKAQAPVRMAVTGRSVGLPLFESLEVLGRERSLARIDSALSRLG
jgi:glutamyl-tRNA synthetase